jgi:2'-5' RNA ligase
MTFDMLLSLVEESSAVRSYSCLMLDCKFLANHLAEIQSHIDPDDVYDDELGHGLENEPHITVLYGLHTQQASDVFGKIEFKPCQFTIKGISSFNNEKYDVLKFDIESKDLRKYNKQLCDLLPYTNKYTDYKIHSTIAYLRLGMAKKYKSLKCNLKGKPLTSDTFMFSTAMSDKTYFVAR